MTCLDCGGNIESNTCVCKLTKEISENLQKVTGLTEEKLHEAFKKGKIYPVNYKVDYSGDVIEVVEMKVEYK